MDIINVYNQLNNIGKGWLLLTTDEVLTNVINTEEDILMKVEIKSALITAGVALVIGITTEIITISIYNDQKKTLVETTEQATVEKLSEIYEDITTDMSYDEAFKIVFEDSENAKRERDELSRELENIKNENNKLNESADRLNADVDKKIEEQAKEYASSGNYLRALIELQGISKITPSIEFLIKEYTQQYEVNVTREVNSFVADGNLDSAKELVDEGLKYLPNNQVLKDLQQRIKDSQPQKMIDVAAKSQSGGDTYKEYSTKTTGGAGFSMGGDKYTDGMEFKTCYYETWAIYPLKSKYHTLNFDLGHVDGSSNDHGGATLQIFFYNDEINEFVLFDEVKLSSDMPPRNISLDVGGLRYIKFQFSRTGYDSWYGIGNPILK